MDYEARPTSFRPVVRRLKDTGADLQEGWFGQTVSGPRLLTARLPMKEETAFCSNWRGARRGSRRCLYVAPDGVVMGGEPCKSGRAGVDLAESRVREHPWEPSIKSRRRLPDATPAPQRDSPCRGADSRSLHGLGLRRRSPDELPDSISNL